MIDPAEVQKRLSYPEGLCQYFLKECGWKGTPENISKFATSMSFLDPSLRKETVLALSSRAGEFLESPQNITSMGGYFLELSPEEWVELILEKRKISPDAIGRSPVFLPNIRSPSFWKSFLKLWVMEIALTVP